MRDWLRSLDERLMRRSARVRSPPVDRVLVALTNAATYSRLWILIAALLLAGGDRRSRRAARRGALANAIAAAIANVPAKLLFRRRRPHAQDSPALIRMPGSSSFPSGHTASAFAFATGVSAEQPLLAPVLVPLAAAVGYSRVHTGVHHPSDVAAGALIGIGSALLAGRLLRARECRANAGGRA
jgi:membrane-associated phospholipid phosphatase